MLLAFNIEMLNFVSLSYSSMKRNSLRENKVVTNIQTLILITGIFSKQKLEITKQCGYPIIKYPKSDGFAPLGQPK